jgi:CheY-like chemotaxis protein
MKGTISVSSTLHKGSCFEITIPLKDSCMDVHKGTITNAAIKKNEEKTYNILVVEDTKTNQIVIQLMLSRLGYNVTLADNGKQAVELIKNDEQFDLIFMDISMPVMDGIEATKQIRAKSLSVPIIALTAHTMDDDKDECLKAGMNEFMLKPMRINEISSVIERFTA